VYLNNRKRIYILRSSPLPLFLPPHPTPPIPHPLPQIPHNMPQIHHNLYPLPPILRIHTQTSSTEIMEMHPKWIVLMEMLEMKLVVEDGAEGIEIK